MWLWPRKQLQQAGDTWKQVHLTSVISKRNIVKGLNVPEYDLKRVKGKIHTIREVIILLFVTILIRGIANLMTHSKCKNVVVKPVIGYSNHIVMVRSYGVLKPGRGKIYVCLRNHSAKQITVPKQTAVGEITTANIILALLAPKPTGHELGKGEATARKRKFENQKELSDKIDLTGLGDWSWNEQKETWELITEYPSIFAISDMDFGKTSLLKHSIRLTDNTPFKDHYQWIPPSMYEEVWEHLKEVLEIGAIWPSHCPWAIPVILVCKKNSKHWFCIDLRKLNAHTIKDSYSLPWKEDNLDNFNGAVWLMALDLKLGYWKVEMDKVSIPFMAFTVGPLGFYECDYMPFRMVNAFQRLMETCLGDFQLSLLSHLSQWHFIFKNAKRSPSLVVTSLPETKGSRNKIQSQ